MTLDEMRVRKRILGFSNETLSKRSGVPLGTVQKVMAGVTRRPRQKTVEALSRALSSDSLQPYVQSQRQDSRDFSQEGNTQDEFLLDSGYIPALYPHISPSDPASYVAEPFPVYRANAGEYTIEDVESLPEGILAELIDGQIYYMACPTVTHQEIIGELHLTIANYIRAHNGFCRVYLSPLAVYLRNDQDYLIPDLTVICDRDKIDDKGCHGAPDWVIEVVSPSSRKRDANIKLFKYRNEGVREYWLIYPDKRIVMTYVFDQGAEDMAIYSFEDDISSTLYPDLKIRLADM